MNNNKNPGLKCEVFTYSSKLLLGPQLSSSSICEIKFYWNTAHAHSLCIFLWLLLHYNKKKPKKWEVAKNYIALQSLKYLHSDSLQSMPTVIWITTASISKTDIYHFLQNLGLFFLYLKKNVMHILHVISGFISWVTGIEVEVI